jgi:transposase
LSGGNEHDIVRADILTEDIYDCFVVEDRGYDSDVHRNNLVSQNNIPVIPGRISRKVEIEYDKELYKQRSKIEILFGKIKENRRLAVRYDKSDLNFLSFIATAFLKINLC